MLSQKAVGSSDTFRLVRVPLGKRTIPQHTFLEELRHVFDAVQRGAEEGRWFADLPGSAEAVLDAALDRFGRYHRSHALERKGSAIVIQDPRLCLYYKNRLNHAAEYIG